MNYGLKERKSEANEKACYDISVTLYDLPEHCGTSTQERSTTELREMQVAVHVRPSPGHFVKR